MRTTLNLDDDIFYTAKHIAQTEKKTAGEVLSDLVRIGLAFRFTKLADPATNAAIETDAADLSALGLFPYFAAQGQIVTNDSVNQLRNEEGI